MEEHAGTGFIPLLLVLFLAFLVPLLLSRFQARTCSSWRNRRRGHHWPLRFELGWC